MKRAVGVGLLLAVLAAPVTAQAGNLYLGLGIGGSQAIDQSDIEGEGGGFELTLGYFFSPRWAFEIAGMLSRFENRFVDGYLGGISLNTRFSPLPRERLQPYLKLGVGAYFLEEDHADAGLAGPGLNVGGGVELFLAPGLSVGAEATWRFIRYTDEYYNDHWGDPIYYDLRDELDGTTLSVAGTLTYHFR
jgi:hypothetical protein